MDRHRRSAQAPSEEGQLTVLSCITGTTDVGKTTWHRIDLGTKSAAVLRWPRVFGTNSRHTLKPSRLYGRCTSSCIRVSLPSDVLWLFSQQHSSLLPRMKYTIHFGCILSADLHQSFGVIRSINVKYTHGHAQMVVQRATARCTVFVRSCVLGLMLEW